MLEEQEGKTMRIWTHLQQQLPFNLLAGFGYMNPLYPFFISAPFGQGPFQKFNTKVLTL